MLSLTRFKLKSILLTLLPDVGKFIPPLEIAVCKGNKLVSCLYTTLRQFTSISWLWLGRLDCSFYNSFDCLGSCLSINDFFVLVCSSSLLISTTFSLLNAFIVLHIFGLSRLWHTILLLIGLDLLSNDALVFSIGRIMRQLRLLDGLGLGDRRLFSLWLPVIILIFFRHSLLGALSLSDLLNFIF